MPIYFLSMHILTILNMCACSRKQIFYAVYAVYLTT
jgi:hypothetical protein